MNMLMFGSGGDNVISKSSIDNECVFGGGHSSGGGISDRHV